MGILEYYFHVFAYQSPWDHLFQPQIYSLKYPIVLMGGVFLVSNLTAVVVMWITGKALKLFKL